MILSWVALSYNDLDADQKKTLRAIRATARREKVPEVFLRAAVQTVLVESGARMVARRRPATREPTRDEAHRRAAHPSS